jgi:hypothetical protein
LIERLAREHNVEFNMEPGILRMPRDGVAQGSSDILIHVKGRAAHAHGAQDAAMRPSS